MLDRYYYYYYCQFMMMMMIIIIIGLNLYLCCFMLILYIYLCRHRYVSRFVFICSHLFFLSVFYSRGVNIHTLARPGGWIRYG